MSKEDYIKDLEQRTVVLDAQIEMFRSLDRDSATRNSYLQENIHYVKAKYKKQIKRLESQNAKQLRIIEALTTPTISGTPM